MRADVTWITTWANDGKLVVINETDVTDFNDFTESLEKVFWKGDMYGIPQVVDGLGMFYNKHLLSEASVTVPEKGFSFDEFKAAGASLNSWVTDNYVGNLTKAQFAAFNMQGYSYAFLPILFGFGGQYFTDDILAKGNMAFNSTGWTEALTFLKSILPEGSAAMTPAVQDQGWGNIDSFFMNGRVAMIFMGPWATSNYLANAPMFNASAYTTVYGGTAPTWVNADNLGFMKVPYNVIDGTTHQGIYSGGHAYVVSTQSEHKAEAVKFADFLAGKKAAYMRSMEHHLVSPRKSTYTSDFDTSDSYVPADDKIVQGFRLNLESGITRPVHPYFIPVDQKVAPILESFRAGNYTVAQTQTELMDKVGALLDTLPVISGGAGFTRRQASPGFELLAVLSSILVMVVITNKKKKMI
jgi:arabinogalactan oligomer/maltooligosaccharide transport system substrate-binding protein